MEYYGVYFGDVNNDGNLDVAAQGGGMHVYVGDGLGNFAEESSGLPLGGATVDIILADLNNDGSLDVVGSEVLLGNGGAGGSMIWTPAPTPGGWNALTAADVNLDGNMDLIAGGFGVRVWTGNGGAGGTLVWTDSSVGLPASGNYWGVEIGDVDHDGKPDIVAADNNNGIKAWTGNGGTGAGSNWTDAYTGTDLPSTESFADVALGDVNNDGNLDVVTTAYYSGNGVRCFLGNGGAGGAMTWTENSTGLDTMTNAYIGVDLEDIDNDGDLDIFATHYQGIGLTTWIGDGGAGGSMDWTESSTGLPSGNYVDVDAGDFNNDGKVDFVASYNGGVEIWENERPGFAIAGYTEMSTGLPTSFTWADVVFEDVNRDGNLDIGFTSFQNMMMGVRVYLGDGSGVWSNSSVGLTMTGGYGGMRFDDLNHDGARDIVSAGVSGLAGIDIWSGDGTGVWNPEASASPLYGGGVEKGDLNDDGNTDIMTGHYSGGMGPMVFLGDGNFSWSSDEGPPVSTMNVDDVAIADVNHDGRMDIAASSMDSIGVQLWTGNGSGLADSWVRNDTGLPTSGVYLGLAFGDVNHDGNPDLAAAGFGPTEGMYVYTGNGGSAGSMLWEDNSSGLPTTGGYGGAEFCDLNLDGDLDLVFAGDWSGAEGIHVRLGNGGSGGVLSWSDPAYAGLPTTGVYWGVACGDVNNDGLLEIGAAKDGAVEVWRPVLQGASPPSVTLTVPNGTMDWSGNSVHDIVWNMHDLEDPNNMLKVYVNYSYNSGSTTGTIAGPLAGVPNPNSYSWSTPSINANDYTVTITVIDTDGLSSSDQAPVPVLDSLNPDVLVTGPDTDEIDVALDRSVWITFDESMNTSSPGAYVTVTPDPGGWSWTWETTSFANDTLTGTHSLFSEGVLYEVVVGTGASDDSDPGNQMVNEYRWNFTTVSDTTAPVIMNASADPSPQEVFLSVNVTANVTDDSSIQSVSANVTWPDSSWSNDTMTLDAGDAYFFERSYSQLGTYSFTVWTVDLSDNWNSSAGTFGVVDTTPPLLSHSVPSTQSVDAPVNITVTATDNFLLDSVRINYTDVGGSVHSELMIPSGGDVYYFVVQGQPEAGTVTYSFVAQDSIGNQAQSPTFDFSVVATWPRPPEYLVVEPNGRGVLRLQWDAPTRNADGSQLTDLQGYNIYRMTESGGTATPVNALPVTETFYNDSGLGDGRTYYYVVRAVNSHEIESVDSNEASGLTLKPPVEDYTWLIILLVLIIIVVILIVLWARRRRSEEQTSSEDETQSEQM
jgi:hypothetical protein